MGPNVVIGSPFYVPVYAPFHGVHVGILGAKGSFPGGLNGPGSLAVDGDTLWIGDGDNHRIQAWDLAQGGRFILQYDGSTGAAASATSNGTLPGVIPSATFKSPYGVAVDEVHVFVAERDAHQVTVLAKATGQVVRTIGKQARMRDPLSVAVNGSYVGVTDSSLNRVLLFNKKTGDLARILGPTLPFEAGGGSFACPCDVLFDGPECYVTDREASRILVFDIETGAYKRQIGSHGCGRGEFTHVNRIAVAHDRLYATDRFGCKVVAFNKQTGDFIQSFGGGEEGILERPNGLCVHRNRVIVADFARSRLHIFG